MNTLLLKYTGILTHHLHLCLVDVEGRLFHVRVLTDRFVGAFESVFGKVRVLTPVYAHILDEQMIHYLDIVPVKLHILVLEPILLI